MKRVFYPVILCLLSISMASGHTPTRSAKPVATSRQTAPPAQTNTSDVPPIEVGNWTKPEPGWLYILDPRPNVDETGGHIWLLDPETGRVMGSVHTGYHPDFALSPDGNYLYVASDTRAHLTELAVLDTSSGAVLGGGTIPGRAEPELIPSFSTMAISDDGRSLRILVKKPNSDEFQLDTIDAASGTLLPGHVNLDHCGDGQFVSFPSVDQVDFVCPTMKKVRFVRTDEKSKELDNSYTEFPWNHKLGVAAAFQAPGGQYITIVRGDGAVFEMDITTLSFYATAAHGGAPQQIFQSAWPRSPDGSKLYLGYTRSQDANATARELRVYDTTTWRKLGTIKTSIPFWSAVAGSDGKHLYALAPQQHAILVIDTSTMREIRTFSVGTMPSLALVAP